MAIEFVFNALAIASFVLMFAGIALFVIGISRGQNARVGVILAVLGLILGLGFLTASQGLLVVGPTEVAVVFNSLSGELETPRDAGFHIVVPGVQQTFIYNIGSQTHVMQGDDAVEARSADGQNIFVDVTVTFNIDEVNVNAFHLKLSTFEQGYLEGRIRPVVRNQVREVMATIRAVDLYGSSAVVGEGEDVSTSSLEEVGNIIEERVINDLAPDGFEVTEVVLGFITFSPEFVDAIESRQVAELERDRASIEAETVQIEAEGRANARIAEARGEAEAIRVVAAAEADALQLVSEQIAANPNLIQYTYINELSDNVSLVIIPSNSPFLFDPASFSEIGADFTAPESQPQEPEPTPEGNGN
jgi:regulator of protease activity HflC (stomatin/prohibitin superfamily)